MNKPSVIGIGYGRHLFDENNIERQRMEMIAGETAVLHQIVFTNQADYLQKQESKNNLVLHPTNSRFKLLMMWDAFVIARRIIKKDVSTWTVTTQDPFAAGVVGWLVSKWCRQYLVVQEHGDVFGLPHWRRESFGNQIWFRVGRFILRQADVVRVVAKRVGTHVQLIGVPTTKITRLPVAIDLSQFKNVARTKKDTETFTFITVARLVPQKNLTLLLSSFHAAWLTQPQLRLRIVGKGPQEAELKKLISQQYKNTDPDSIPVTMEAWSDNIPALLAQSDAYVLSSDYEGWGRVLIEALVVGLPIVTTDVGCVGEVIVNEQNGLVVEPRDTEALQAAMKRMATDNLLQLTIKQNYDDLVLSNIPGTNLETYGEQWVESLRVN